MSLYSCNNSHNYLLKKKSELKSCPVTNGGASVSWRPRVSVIAVYQESKWLMQTACSHRRTDPNWSSASHEVVAHEAYARPEFTGRAAFLTRCCSFCIQVPLSSASQQPRWRCGAFLPGLFCALGASQSVLSIWGALYVPDVGSGVYLGG